MHRLVVEALLIAVYLRKEHILIDTRKYDRQIVLAIPPHSASPA
jgi:hypothetical protein